MRSLETSRRIIPNYTRKLGAKYPTRRRQQYKSTNQTTNTTNTTNPRHTIKYPTNQPQPQPISHITIHTQSPTKTNTAVPTRTMRPGTGKHLHEHTNPAHIHPNRQHRQQTKRPITDSTRQPLLQIMTPEKPNRHRPSPHPAQAVLKNLRRLYESPFLHRFRKLTK